MEAVLQPLNLSTRGKSTKSLWVLFTLKGLEKTPLYRTFKQVLWELLSPKKGRVFLKTEAVDKKLRKRGKAEKEQQGGAVQKDLR